MSLFRLCFVLAAISPNAVASASLSPATAGDVSEGRRTYSAAERSGPSPSAGVGVPLPPGLRRLAASIQSPQMCEPHLPNFENDTAHPADLFSCPCRREQMVLVEDSHEYYRRIILAAPAAAAEPAASASSTAGAGTFVSPSVAGATAFRRRISGGGTDGGRVAVTEEGRADADLVSSPGRLLGGRADIDDGVPIDVMNSPVRTWPVNNSLFEGRICLLLRDHPGCTYDFDGEDNVYFELQMQGRFKRRPLGPLYLAVELPQEEEWKISWPVKTIINTCVAFIKSWGYKLVHMSFGGKGDVPHIATPAFQAFDRVIISNPSDPLPNLGEPVREPHESMVLRKKFQFQHTIDPSLIYTMSFNHTYLNPVDWRMYGVPIIREFDVSALTDVMRLSIYEVAEERGGQSSKSANGDVRAIATGRHAKRNVAMWVQLQRREAMDSNHIQ